MDHKTWTDVAFAAVIAIPGIVAAVGALKAARSSKKNSVALVKHDANLAENTALTRQVQVTLNHAQE